MDIMTRPSLLPSILLLSLFAVQVDSSSLSPLEPQLINATDTTLAFSPERVLCPPYCDVILLEWRIKTWYDSNWSFGPTLARDRSVTFKGLVPGIEYHATFLPVLQRLIPFYKFPTKLTKAYTCSRVVPQPCHFSITERKNNSIVVEWYVPSQLCISAKFFLLKAPEAAIGYDNYLHTTCLQSPFRHDPQPEYACIANETKGFKQKCTARFEDPEPEQDYFIGVLTVDVNGRCSEKNYHVTSSLREYSSGISTREIALIVLGTVMIVFAVAFAFLKLQQRCRRQRQDLESRRDG